MKTANILSTLGLAIFMMANTAVANAKNNEPVRKPVHTAAAAPAHKHNVAPAPHHNVAPAKPAPAPAKPAVKPAACNHSGSFAPGQHKPATSCAHHKPAPKQNVCHASAHTCKVKNCKTHKHAHSCACHS